MRAPTYVNQLLAAISSISEIEIREKLRRSPVIGAGIDESTDRSNEKHIATVVRSLAYRQLN